MLSFNKNRALLDPYQDMTETQTDDPLAKIAKYSSLAGSLGSPRPDENRYRQLLENSFNTPIEQPRENFDPATNQFLAGLAESANKLGTLGGVAPKSPEVSRLAEVLNQQKSMRQQQAMKQQEGIRNLLAKLSESREKSERQQQEDALKRELNQNRITSSEKIAANRLVHMKPEKEKTSTEKLDLTPAEKKIDEEFGKKRGEFLSVGKPRIMEAIKALEDVSTELRQNESASGGVRGLAPDWWRSITNPEAIALKRKVKRVALESAKELLGGGVLSDTDIKLILENAWADQANPKDNADAIDVAIRKAESNLIQREAEMSYFEGSGHGSLKGFQTKAPKRNDKLEDASDEELDAILERYKNGARR